MYPRRKVLQLFYPRRKVIQLFANGPFAVLACLFGCTPNEIIAARPEYASAASPLLLHPAARGT
jgi:hypothetical protein